MEATEKVDEKRAKVTKATSLTTAQEIQAALKFIKKLAVNPTIPANPANQERATVLALNRALYEGPELGKKSKKKEKPAECSPRLFLNHNSISTRLAAGGPSQKHTFGSFEDYLHVVAQCYYTEAKPTQVSKVTTKKTSSSSSSSSSSTSSTSHSSPSTDSDSVVTPAAPPLASLYLQRETMLGKLSHLWRQRSPMDTWAPLEIALFESAMCIYGKGMFIKSCLYFFMFCFFFTEFTTPTIKIIKYLCCSVLLSSSHSSSSL